MLRASRTLIKQACFVAVGIVVFAVACSHPAADNTADAYRAKMKLVVEEAIRQASDPLDKAALRDCEIFVNVEGLKLDQDVIGISVPTDKTGHHTHVAFMADHFRATPVTTLATEVLKDLAGARTENRQR